MSDSPPTLGCVDGSHASVWRCQRHVCHETSSVPPPHPRASRGATGQKLTRRLAESLALLEEGRFLVLSVRHRRRLVQFARVGEDGLRAERAWNQYLATGDRLGAADHRALRQLGWRSPSRRAVGSGSHGADDGSPNWLRVFPSPVDAEAALELAVRTLTEVQGVRRVDSSHHTFRRRISRATSTSC